MTIPSVGLWRDDRHNYTAVYADHEPAEGPGATAPIGIIDKPAIIGWAKNETAACAVRNYDLLGQMISTGGPGGAAKWLAGIPDYQRDTAADVGAEVHRHAEQVSRGATPDVPEALLPYVDGYRSWLAAEAPKLVSVEKSVFSYQYQYGGTYDLIADLGDERWLLDIKTWKREPRVGSDMYAETGLQLAAYGHAEFIGLPNDPKRYPMPRIDHYGVLHLRPDLYQRGYALIPFDVGYAEFEAFLGALTIWRWKRDRAKRVISERLEVAVA